MKAILKCLTVISIVILGSFSTLLLLNQFAGVSGGALTRLIPFGWMLGTTWFFWSLVERRSMTELGLLPLSDNLRAFSFGILLGLTPLLISLIFCMIKAELFLPKLPLEMKAFLVNLSYYFLVAFSEELLYRGYLSSILPEKFAWLLRASLVSLLFAGMHFISPEFNLANFILIFLMGIFLSFVLLKTKNLWMIIGLHWSWNLGMIYFEMDGVAMMLTLGLISLGMKILMKKDSGVKSRNV